MVALAVPAVTVAPEMGAAVSASVTVPVIVPVVEVRAKFCVVVLPAISVTLALWLA